MLLSRTLPPCHFVEESIELYPDAKVVGYGQGSGRLVAEYGACGLR